MERGRFVRLVNEFHSSEGAIPISIFFLLFFESVRIPVQCLATSFVKRANRNLNSPLKSFESLGFAIIFRLKGKLERPYGTLDSY